MRGNSTVPSSLISAIFDLGTASKQPPCTPRAGGPPQSTQRLFGPLEAPYLSQYILPLTRPTMAQHGRGGRVENPLSPPTFPPSPLSPLWIPQWYREGVRRRDRRPKGSHTSRFSVRTVQGRCNPATPPSLPPPRTLSLGCPRFIVTPSTPDPGQEESMRARERKRLAEKIVRSAAARVPHCDRAMDA